MSENNKAPLIDFSAGDPIYPFSSLAEDCFKKSVENIHQYALSDPDNEMSKPIKDALDNMAPYFVERGLITEGDKERFAHRCIVAGGGTSESFEFILRMLMQDIVKEKTKNKRPLRPVILMPTPTYGLFVNQVKQWGFPIVYVKRDIDNQGHLNLEDVRKTIEKLTQQGRRVVAYFDSNPNNPTGLVRGEEETKALGQLFYETSNTYQEMDAKSGMPWTGPAARIVIIDDMVYDGTEYEGVTPAYSFAQLPNCVDDCFMLMGLSKIGLAGLRAGLAIGPERLMKYLWELQKNSTYFASKPALYGLESYFSTNDDNAKAREGQLEKLRQAHQTGALLMKALINGLDSMEDVRPEDKTIVIEIIKTSKSISDVEALMILNNPLDHVKVSTTPQSGFFHVLDFSKLKYSKFIKGNETTVFNEDEKILLQFITNETDLVFLRSEWVGLNYDEFLFRTTYAMSSVNIIDAVERLHVFLKRIELSELKGSA